jgi:hypothetical protein
MRLRFLPLIIFTAVAFPLAFGMEITHIGEYNFGVAYDVVIREEVAYLSGNEGVEVIKITDRSNPVKLTRISTSIHGALGLYISGETLYVSATSNGLMILDISDPETPEIISMVQGIDAVDVYVSQEYAYVASGTSFSIIDIREPSNPEIITTVRGGGTIYNIHAIQDTLYVGDVGTGLKVYDIADPNTPEYIKTVPGTTGIFDIASNTDTLYLGCHGQGLKILDITDRQNPQLIGSYNNGGEVYGIDIVDSLLLVADLQQGIEMLNVSNPASLTLEAKWENTYPHKIVGDAQYIYLADQDHGLRIFTYGENAETTETNQENNMIPMNTAFIAAGLIGGVFLLKKRPEKLSS